MRDSNAGGDSGITQQKKNTTLPVIAQYLLRGAFPTGGALFIFNLSTGEALT
jgi:hypothetical protein